MCRESGLDVVACCGMQFNQKCAGWLDDAKAMPARTTYYKRSALYGLIKETMRACGDADVLGKLVVGRR